MCRIKSGAMISNNEDVRNMITGIILRQRDEYQEESILEFVEYNMKGCDFLMDKAALLRLIQNCLDVFDRNDMVRCKKGHYLTLQVN